MVSIGWVILVIAALSTLAWQWLNTRHKFNAIELSLSQKLEQYQAINKQSLALAKQAEERSTQANMRTIVLEQKLAESRDQQEALQTLYTQLAESRESTAVAEVEQLLNIASQQLQLNGNVKSALLALQAAHKRLEPLELPRAIQLRPRSRAGRQRSWRWRDPWGARCWRRATTAGFSAATSRVSVGSWRTLKSARPIFSTR